MKNITYLFLLFATFMYAQSPITNPAAPTNDAVDVISIYGDTFTNVATNYDPNWGQSGHLQVNTSFDPGFGVSVLAYPNFNYQGTELTTQNAADMEFLHVDIWTSANPGATDIQVSPINNGTGAGETLVSIAYNSGSWTSVDIPKSAFTGMIWDSVFQIKFAANGPGSTVPVDIYLDNVYFWKNPTPPGSDATLSALEIDGVPLTAFSSATTSYTVELTPGTTVAPQITTATATDPAATSVIITQAPAVPGDATVVVVSQNGLVTETYTVSFIIAGPTMAAPTPPVRQAQDVISLYSNAYTNTTIETWNASFDDSTSEDVVAFGGDIKKIEFGNFFGAEFTNNRIDASAMTHFHMDFWTDNPDLVGKVFNSKFSQWGGTASEVSALELNINGGSTPPLATGEWVSIDVEIATNFSNNLTRDDLAQFLIVSNLGVVYVDNIYFWRAATVAPCTANVLTTTVDGVSDTQGSTTDSFLLESTYSGTGNLSVQWQILPSDFSTGWTNINGATNANLLLSNLMPDTYYYRVRVVSDNLTPSNSSDDCSAVSASAATLVVTGPSTPANDDCADATLIALGTEFSGDTSTATDSGIAASSCGATGGDQDLWYSFVAPLSTTVALATTADFVIIYDACAGSEVACLANGEQSPALMAGNTYYVRIYNSGFAKVAGPFTATFTEASLTTQDFNNSLAFSYYPNPVNNTLALNAQQAITNVVVFNMLGQEVIRTAPNAVSNDVDMSSLQSGAYFVQVTVGTTVETVRIIKN